MIIRCCNGDYSINYFLDFKYCIKQMIQIALTIKIRSLLVLCSKNDFTNKLLNSAPDENNLGLAIKICFKGLQQ